MKLYLPIKESLFHPDIGPYCSWGIACLQFSPEGCRQTAFVSDVSVELAFVHKLARRCTRSQLAPVHLRDVVADALEEQGCAPAFGPK